MKLMEDDDFTQYIISEFAPGESVGIVPRDADAVFIEVIDGLLTFSTGQEIYYLTNDGRIEKYPFDALTVAKAQAGDGAGFL